MVIIAIIITIIVVCCCCRKKSKEKRVPGRYIKSQYMILFKKTIVYVHPVTLYFLFHSCFLIPMLLGVFIT